MRKVACTDQTDPIQNADAVVYSFLPAGDDLAKIRETPTVVAGGALIDRVRVGLPFAEFSALAEMLALPEDAMAAVLSIPRATLHRRKKVRQLAREESERVVRFARVFGLAVELFGTGEAAREWLKAPAIAFDGGTPLEYMDTELGARMVEDLLGRLGHGVFT